MADSDKQIAALELLLEATEANDPSRPVLEARLAMLRDTTECVAPRSEQRGGVDLGNLQVERIDKLVGQDDVAGDKVLRDKIVYTTPPGDDPASLVRRYYAHVIRETQRLTFVDADSADAEQAPISLDQVYIRLEVATQIDKDGKPLDAERRGERQMRDPARQMTALEALQHHGRLVLLGAPGSGKSTFARHLAFCLACAGSGEAGLEQLAPEWQGSALTPIWIELSLLAAWIGQHDAGQSPGELFWAYLGAQHSLDLAAELRRRLECDAAVLLLDGLDEVAADADGQPLRRVRAMIEALTATRSPRVVLLTCRLLDYAEPRRKFKLARWPAETLLPFSDKLQQAFIANWYRTLEREGRPLQRGADELIARLGRAVREKPDLKRLAGNPLLLTMMATLQGAKGELPDKRVELYGECLDQLLRRWRRRADRPDLESYLAIPGWSRAETDRLLDHLGYAAESHRGSDEEDEEQAVQSSAHLTHRQLIDAAADVFASYVPNPLTYAEKLCDYIERYGSNGIVQQHGPDNYRFPHRTFREFLAARRLISNRDWPEDERGLTLRLACRATDARWHEALLLAASLLVTQSRAESVADLARVLLQEHKTGSRAWAERAVVAGEVLTQTDRRQLEGFREAHVWDNTVAALCRILDSSTPAKRYDAATRVRAGTVLGQLGDPRPGVLRLEPDWRVAPAGSFPLGSTNEDEEAYDDEKPQRTVELPGFRIARYPVTNAQWRAFLEAGGYRERRWWSDTGWQTKEQEGWSQPAYWDTPRFNGANQPIVGISWYEAIAFCRWLSVELEYDVRLPSEAEWEKAARGADGRIYPWGDQWDADYANVGENSLAQTAPVGCYPRDCSPYNVMDMSGNVWEWTATPLTDGYEESDGTACGTEDGSRFITRGGAWDSNRRYARCAYCGNVAPASRNDCLGMRVVAALTPED